MDRNMSLGDDTIDWGDVNFSTPDFPDSMTAESPWGNSALNDFTNLADYADSPAAPGLRTPSKSGPEPSSAPKGQPGTVVPPSQSTGSSSQDSSSDSSSRRKRKTTSASPYSETMTEKNATVKVENPTAGVQEYRRMSGFGQPYNQRVTNLSVEPGMSDNGDTMFDFQSAASSPNLNREYQQLSLDPKMKFPATNVGNLYAQESPVQTINPGMFTLGGSRDQSPVTTNMMFNTASPNAMFSTPSSDSNDAFNANATWNGNMATNPSWAAEFSNQFTSPGALGLTPSPMPNGGTPTVAARGLPTIKGRSPLHIAPISAKSRVETQINVVMTLERPPPGVENLHLPLHTIAKSKLLAKEDYDPNKVLELHTMLVCTSAMHNEANKEKALQRAAAQNNVEIQRRAELPREPGDDDRNDPKNIPEEDRPLNGGEVRICPNCIQRERKRAGRKKLKREEEQQHWERYETERVVVFNSNEYLPFKPFDPSQQPQKDSMAVDDPYTPPDGAISVSAAMRIACYCRHQSEKEGFQVIFTLKTRSGKVVGQQISDSILITDDHKTHPPTLATMSGGDVFYSNSQFGNNAHNTLAQSHSMVDLSVHQQPFQSSRSTGNLQALGYGSQYNPSSHVHHMSQSGFGSQATSATMTPTTLSRPGSPTSAGQSGPNKKRKSSTFHRRVPSGLQMTPRVDTNQASSSNISSAVSTQMPGTFSPTMAAGFNQNDASFMTVPQNSGPAPQFYNSRPATPSTENGPFQFNQGHQLDLTRAQNASAYFSHPSSAVPSRSSSPVLQSSRPNMAAFARQQPIQTPTNSVNRTANPAMFAAPSGPGVQGSEDGQSTAPIITKITPNEGPVSGGTEVSIFGYNFTHSTQIMFGDSVAPTTFYGSQCILATSPPGRRGGVRVSSVPVPGQQQFASPAGTQPVFTYKDGLNPQMMEMALRFLSQQQTGDPSRWVQYTNEVANQFMATSISPAGIQGQGFGGGGNMMALSGGMDLEDVVLKVFDLVDVSESPRQPQFDMRAKDGQTMLSLACMSGMHRVVAALIARGASPDVRDNAGYTPLMLAALHGLPKTFQLLLNKGADPTIRCLTGYSAIDLVPADALDAFTQIQQNTQRSRVSRPSIYSRATRISFGSTASSKQSWDISSASFYESEADSSDATASYPPSRRPSANIALTPIPCESPAVSGTIMLGASSAAVAAWRDALATQIHHFQQHVHSSMSHFQLPALPPLPEYRDNAMVRRLSSLASSSWDMFSPSNTSPMPPPAYDEIFPSAARDNGMTNKEGMQDAIVDAVADEKCMAVYDEEPTETIKHRGVALASTRRGRLNTADLAAPPPWLWMPLLAALMAPLAVHTVLPSLSAVLPTGIIPSGPLAVACP